MDDDIGIYYPELNDNGEFYIDESIIDNFGIPLKIEAGFYHVSLISFLVYNIPMPIKNIKYKLIARHGLKNDTFKDFSLYIFNNFEESQAKLLCNSFIGELERKHTRSDHGFTYKDLDTAQCIWTQGLAENKNVTIDNYKELYLIREKII